MSGTHPPQLGALLGQPMYHMERTICAPLRRQGHVVPFTVVEGPEAWTVAQYRDNQEYVYVLSEADVAELDAAVAGVRDRDLKVRRAGSWALGWLPRRAVLCGDMLPGSSQQAAIARSPEMPLPCSSKLAIESLSSPAK